jgi:hypothetical protein
MTEQLYTIRLLLRVKGLERPKIRRAAGLPTSTGERDIEPEGSMQARHSFPSSCIALFLPSFPLQWKNCDSCLRLAV